MMLSLLLSACTNKEETNKEETSLVETQTISMDDVQKKIGKKNWVIVDTRINDAFNGWELDGVERGGHIKGAVDFSAGWLKADVDKKG